MVTERNIIYTEEESPPPTTVDDQEESERAFYVQSQRSLPSQQGFSHEGCPRQASQRAERQGHHKAPESHLSNSGMAIYSARKG